MEASQEYLFGLGLIRKFEEQLREIAQAESFKSAKPLISAIIHPVTGAMAQIKEGKGPLREDLLRVLATVVSEFREQRDFRALREAIEELLTLVEQEQHSSVES